MATLSRMMKKAVSSLIPLANRTVHHRNYSSSIFTTPLKNCISSSRQVFPRASIPTLNFSSQAKKKPSSDESLLTCLDDEIQCALESDDHEVVEAPGGFPFKIEDNPGEKTITLTREYQGENINVIVHMNNLVTGEDGEVDHDDDDQAEGGVSSPQSSVPLVVIVSKGSGPMLEFSVMAYPDEISIDSMTMKQPNASEELIPYEGPDFSELDENLQKAFHKYLEIRGIKPKTTNFLHEYMINKDSREYLNWLKDLKAFVAK
ncbi:hypothetical protein MKW98_020971 [Papaver atlanticum]|uniref:Mitochondrial glycoprotein family protein n=1 Tax=Papaver atlanticum TaxID=357466 RepID=A0AAD4SM63_9MAGN|nr:hypothetical protein MKW98_020971 [Papaver atlanticum]